MKGILALWAAVVLASLAGWIINVVDVIQSPALALWTGVDVMHAIGIVVVPIGAIMGLFF